VFVVKTAKAFFGELLAFLVVVRGGVKFSVDVVVASII